MAVTLAQTCTATPTALAGTSAGRWLLRANAAYPVQFAVATSAPADDTPARMQVFANQEVVIEAGESIYIWQPTPNLVYFANRGFGSIAYQKVG